MMNDFKTQAMLNALAAQREQAANALVEQMGINALIQAEWQARWSSKDELRARLAELEAQG